MILFLLLLFTMEDEEKEDGETTIDGLGVFKKRHWFGKENASANYCLNECL